MSKEFNNWTFSDVIKVLRKNGFLFHKSRGSHFQYKKKINGKMHLVVVQSHGKKSIPVGTMHSIIRQSGLDKKVWKK